MIIQQKRIRNLSLHLGIIEEGTPIIIGFRITDDLASKLNQIGFSDGINVGDAVLPAKIFGPKSRYNAEGKFLVHRDQPMETVYRWVEWHWIEWHGQEKVEKSDLKPVPYERYPRELIKPPSIEFQIVSNTEGNLFVIAPKITYTQENSELLTHTINLFLEIFGLCEIFTENLDSILTGTVRRLNWRILPPGRRPWAEMKELLEPMINEAKKGNQPAILDRFERINGRGPEFTAIGTAGFAGYVVFGFPDRDLYILESRFPGNATYIFNSNWEQLSKLSKGEILNNNLQEYRFIHSNHWYEQINGIFH